MKTHSKIVLATGAVMLGGLVLAGATYARGGFGGHGFGPHGGGHGGGPMMMFEQLDGDGNGEVTSAEAEGAVDSRFTGADVDGDGALSLEEFQPLLVELMRPRIVDGFQFLDEDGDAKITREEVDRPLGRLISHLDRDHDGTVTLDELRPQHRGGWGHHGDQDRDRDDD